VRETPVVNGDVGLVLDMVPTERRGMDVIVLFRDPDRLCTLPLGDCHLIRAWCITTHKAQGRGIPYVILPVHRSFYWDAKRGTGLACRENLYTRFSRASKLLVTVGSFAAIEAEVRRPTVARRRTRLKSLIQLEPDGVPR
jgi:ATP-dependent exoDNAse (exonuclease V) alpha subunit